MQEKATAEVKAMKEEVASMQRKLQEMEGLVEDAQTRAADAVAKKDAQLGTLQAQAQTHEATIAKLRTELQTALNRPKVQVAPQPTVANAADAAELARLKALTAEQADKIERLLKSPPPAAIDRSELAKLMKAVSFVLEFHDKPDKADLVEWARFYAQDMADNFTQ